MKLKLDFKMLFPKEPAFNLARHKWRQNVQLVVVQNYLKRTGREEWAKQFPEAAKRGDDSGMLNVMSNDGEEVVTALGSEVDRLEKEIQELVPGIRHVDIEEHIPIDQSL
ncbi:unnamed protein product [Brassica oleracea]